MAGQQANNPQGTAEQVNPWHLPPKQAHPAWSLNQPLSMHVHLSTSHNGDIFSQWRKDEELPSFVWENITYGDWNDARVINLDVKLPEVSRFTKGRYEPRANSSKARHAEWLVVGRCIPCQR
jgi:hypothetical protein